MSADATAYSSVSNCEIPYTGIEMHLKGFGLVKVFRTVFKNEFRHYIIYRLTLTKLLRLLGLNSWTSMICIGRLNLSTELLNKLPILSVSSLDRLWLSPIISLLLFPLLSILQLRCIHNLITNCYALKRNLFNDVIRSLSWKT
ncbi:MULTISPECIES: hypothetical protein [Pseudanabaena]|uniref:Uncharacterized protein n=1 Tax=Pseudanabaena catenata USMAC16 TaxID=1855837 RepID=A0A9X4RIX8_9CYAN|nr:MULTISPECIES: hypothetical protein [Pseudanabaena]MDG3495495.1 hypothetical protein [Pseudanabaena catenata USMAC16]